MCSVQCDVPPVRFGGLGLEREPELERVVASGGGSWGVEVADPDVARRPPCCCDGLHQPAPPPPPADADEEPESAELVLDARDAAGTMRSAEGMAAEILAYLEARGYLAPPPPPAAAA